MTAWGKLIATTGSLANTVGANQPFRYRGYVYDEETGWYYLQSRYYDPTTCRFISADVLLSTGQGVIGHNSFAYCLNNPVNAADSTGSFPLLTIFVVAVVVVAVGLTATGCTNKPTSDVGAAQPYVNMKGSNDPNTPNCYAYAIGSSKNEQPGNRSGRIPQKWYDVEDVGKSVIADLKTMGYTVRPISGPNDKVYDNEFKIALRVGTKPCRDNLRTGEVIYPTMNRRNCIMTKGTKYSIIANSISSFQNPVARRHGAESIMIHALKYILAPELRDWEMPIVCNNTYYMVLKGQFDNTGNTQLVNVFNDPHGIIPVAVKAVVTRPRRKNLKKAKKQVSRVYHDFKRARREGLLGDVGNNYDFAIKSICNATKEAYIITRKRIAPAVHEIIPVVETVALTTGNSSLKDLFVEQQNTTLKGTKNYFALEKEYGFEDSHAIQYKLSTYSFEHIFSNRR